ncbi:MAG: mechanosensitive ion channel [Elusimicrobia bacterium]|nr:mechanosensitive ion channel [Elusimicrobiota bacterium]
MKFQPIIALSLCAVLTSPSAAQTRVAAGVSRVPAGISVVPVLGVSGFNAAPSLNSAVLTPSLALGLTPVTSPAASAAPIVAQAATVPVLPAAAIPVTAAAAAKAAVPAALTTIHAAAAREMKPSDSPVALRAEGEQFWSGAASKPETDDAVPAAATPVKSTSRLLRGAAMLAPVAALPALPGLAQLPEWATTALPYAESLGALAAAYGLTRVSRWVIDKLAPRLGLDKDGVVLARFATSAVLWVAGVSVSLVTLGLPAAGVLTAVGASAGVTTLNFLLAPTTKDIAGNLFQGVRFLLSRPFNIGDKVTIGKTTGVVHDLTLRYMVLKAEDGSYILRTYNQVAAAGTILYGSYQTKALRLHLSKPALPRGLLRAIKDAATPALWKPILWSAGAIVALSFFPLLAPAVAATAFGWVGAVLPWVQGGLVAILTNSISKSIRTGIDKLQTRYGWSRPVTTVVKLGVSALSWLIGGSFLLNSVGVSWMALGIGLVVSTALVSTMINDQLNAAIQGAILLKSKVFHIGDKVTIGDNAGEVIDITLDYVVLKLDADRFMLLPHAVVKESAIITPREYGARPK